MPASTRDQQATRLDDVRQVLRLHHSSIHTERSSVEWIVRCVRFHGMRLREALFPAEPQIEAFPTDLAVHDNVAAATQQWAIHALVFLYTQVRKMPVDQDMHAGRARRKEHVPVVLQREEVDAISAHPRLLFSSLWPPTAAAAALTEREKAC